MLSLYLTHRGKEMLTVNTVNPLPQLKTDFPPGCRYDFAIGPDYEGVAIAVTKDKVPICHLTLTVNQDLPRPERFQQVRDFMESLMPTLNLTYDPA